MVLETHGTLMIYKPCFENLAYFLVKHIQNTTVFFSAESRNCILYSKTDTQIKSSLKRQAMIKLVLQIYVIAQGRNSLFLRAFSSFSLGLHF